MLGVFLSGAFMMALIVIGLIFLRTWKDTGERFFGIFGLAFWLLALERVPLALWHQMKEPGSLVYLLRLIAFALIIGSVLERNFFPGRDPE